MTLRLDISRWHRDVEIEHVMDHTDLDNPRELMVGAAHTCKPGYIRLVDMYPIGGGEPTEMQIPLSEFRDDLYQGKYVIKIKDVELSVDDSSTDEIVEGFENLRMEDRT